jgi:hypothetical protein
MVLSSKSTCFAASKWLSIWGTTTSFKTIQNVRQLEAALHQYHIRQLIAGMVWKVEAVIQARGGVTRYCNLKHGCRRVTEKS